MSKYDSRCFWFGEQSMGNPGTVPVCGMSGTVESFSCENCKTYIGRATARDLIKRKVKPVTNGDRIRAMRDEELAKQIAGEQVNGVRVFLHGLDYELENEFMDEVKKTWPELVKEKLDWLKQEAKT